MHNVVNQEALCHFYDGTISNPWPFNKSKFNLKSDRVNLVAPASPIECLLNLRNVRGIQYTLGPERLTRLGNSNALRLPMRYSKINCIEILKNVIEKSTSCDRCYYCKIKNDKYKLWNVENINIFLVKEENIHNIDVRRYDIKVKIRAKLFDYIKNGYKVWKKDYKERDQSFLAKFLHKIYPVKKSHKKKFSSILVHVIPTFH